MAGFLLAFSVITVLAGLCLAAGIGAVREHRQERRRKA